MKDIIYFTVFLTACGGLQRDDNTVNSEKIYTHSKEGPEPIPAKSYRLNDLQFEQAAVPEFSSRTEPDQIKGQMTFNGTEDCSGGEVLLRREGGDEVARVNLQDHCYFLFTNLPEAKFRLELSAGKFDLAEPRLSYKPGKFYKIQLRRNTE